MITFREVTLGIRAPQLLGIDCVLRDGVVTAVVGPAKAGKTLLLDGITGRIAPLRGLVQVRHLDSSANRAAVKSWVCMVPVSAPLLGHLTVMEHVRLALGLSGQTAVPDRRIIDTLRTTELADRLMSRRCDGLAPCERLSVWLAIHQLRNTTILLLDDPARDLPAADASALVPLIRETAVAERATIVTSRSPDFGLAVGDDVLEIDSAQLKSRSRPHRSAVCVQSEISGLV